MLKKLICSIFGHRSLLVWRDFSHGFCSSIFECERCGHLSVKERKFVKPGVVGQYICPVDDLSDIVTGQLIIIPFPDISTTHSLCLLKPGVAKPFLNWISLFTERYPENRIPPHHCTSPTVPRKTHISHACQTRTMPESSS